MGLEEVAFAHLWSLRWQWQLLPAHGSPVGSVLLPGSTHRERSSYGNPAPLLMRLQIMMPCLSRGSRLLPITPSVATAQPFQAVSTPHSGPVPGTELQCLSFSTRPPPPTNRGVSQVGECRVVVLTLSAGYSLFCLPQTGCFSVLLGSETPPPSRLISPLVRRLPKVREPFLLHSSLPGVQALS